MLEGLELFIKISFIFETYSLKKPSSVPSQLN